MIARALVLSLLTLGPLAGAAVIAPVPAAAAEEAWKAEFDRICGQTDNAADLSVEELKKAVAKCDALKPQIEALETTPRKLYLKRLQMCRNLFTYLIDTKEKK